MTIKDLLVLDYIIYLEDSISFDKSDKNLFKNKNKNLSSSSLNLFSQSKDYKKTQSINYILKNIMTLMIKFDNIQNILELMKFVKYCKNINETKNKMVDIFSSLYNSMKCSINEIFLSIQNKNSELTNELSISEYYCFKYFVYLYNKLDKIDDYFKIFEEIKKKSILQHMENKKFLRTNLLNIFLTFIQKEILSFVDISDFNILDYSKFLVDSEFNNIIKLLSNNKIKYNQLCFDKKISNFVSIDLKKVIKTLKTIVKLNIEKGIYINNKIKKINEKNNKKFNENFRHSMIYKITEHKNEKECNEENVNENNDKKNFYLKKYNTLPLLKNKNTLNSDNNINKNLDNSDNDIDDDFNKNKKSNNNLEQDISNQICSKDLSIFRNFINFMFYFIDYLIIKIKNFINFLF